jgi:hypothetical protein
MCVTYACHADDIIGGYARLLVQSWLQSVVHGACYHLSTRRDRARAKSARLPVPLIVGSEIPRQWMTATITFSPC